MTSQLEIQPRELRFVVEFGKQSKCTIRLINKTDQNVAFKVKTTSPKKYCVRPNVGIVQPKASHEFVVIMQAPKETPVDLTCKDKFLIQSTIAPEGTLDEDVTSEMFHRDGGRYIEESKLRVILGAPAPARSAEWSPVNGIQKQVDEHVVPKTVNSEELKLVKDADVTPVYNVKLEPIKNARFEPIKTVNADLLEDADLELTKDILQVTRNNEDVKAVESRASLGEEEQRLYKEVEEMKFKLHELESKLSKTETTISRLTEERRLAVYERESVQQEMAILRKRKVTKRVRDGFPLLFVCMVALISLVVGYGFHP